MERSFLAARAVLKTQKNLLKNSWLLGCRVIFSKKWMKFIRKSGDFLHFYGQKVDFCNKNVFFWKNYAIFSYVNVSEGSFD